MSADATNDNSGAGDSATIGGQRCYMEKGVVLCERHAVVFPVAIVGATKEVLHCYKRWSSKLQTYDDNATAYK